MPRFDDAGMHRPDRDLMQTLALRGEEIVSGVAWNVRARAAQRKLYIPETEIEPGARIGRTDGDEPVKAVHGPLQPDRGRMQRTDRRKRQVQAQIARNGDRAGIAREYRHMHRRRAARLAPKAEQRRLPCRKLGGQLSPGLRRDHGARPRPVDLDAGALRQDVFDRWHARYPRSLATFSNQPTRPGGR